MVNITTAMVRQKRRTERITQTDLPPIKQPTPTPRPGNPFADLADTTNTTPDTTPEDKPKPSITERYYVGADPAYYVPGVDPNIAKARKQIAEARGKLLSQEQQIIATKAPTPTRAELSRQTQLIGARRKEAGIKLESQKSAALTRIKKIRTEVLQPYEKEVETTAASQKARRERIIALNAAIATYARTGDADDIRKYGKDIQKEAVQYVESHQVRGVTKMEPVFSGEYVDPEGVGQSVLDIRDIDTSAGGTFTPVYWESGTQKTIRGEPIVLGTSQTFDFAKLAEEKGVTQEEIDIYDTTFRTRDEARRLALLSKEYQMSFSPELQKDIITQRRIEKAESYLSPYGKSLLFDKTLFGTQQEAFKEDTNILTKSVKGGVGLVKGVVFAPFGMLESGISKTGKRISKEGQKIGGTGGEILDWTGAIVNVGSEFVPSTPARAAGLFAGYKAFQFGGGIVRGGLIGLGVTEGTKAETKEDIIRSGLMIGGGAWSPAKNIFGATLTKVSKWSPKQQPFLSMGRPVRERATVVLYDSSGKKILYHVDKNTGTYMLPGGKIGTSKNPKESPLSAAKRELYEETGLKNIKLKKSDIIKTGEHKHYVYEGKLPKGTKLSDLAPAEGYASEVGSYRWVKPPKDYTGGTAFEPYGRVPSRFRSFLGGRESQRIVRYEDLFIGAKTKYPKIQQTTLVIGAPQETFIVGGKPRFLQKRVKKTDYFSRAMGYKPGQFKKFQKQPGIEVGFGSRYDIPYSQLKVYEGQPGLWYVSGAPKPVQTQFKGLKESFIVEKRFMKRGQEGFYFQPPVTGKPGSPGYLGATYLGLYKKPRAAYGMGVRFRKGSPSVYTGELVLEGEIFATRKAKRGKEFEAIAEAGQEINVLGTLPPTMLAGRRVNIFEVGIGESPTGISGRILKGKIKRGQEEAYYELTGKRPKQVSEVLEDISPSGAVSGYITPTMRTLPYTVPYKPSKPEPYVLKPTYKTPRTQQYKTIYEAPSYKAPTYTTPPYTISGYITPTYKTPPYTTPPYTTPPYRTPPYKTPPYTPPLIPPRRKPKDKRKPKIGFKADKYITKVRRRGKWIDLAETRDLITAKVKGIRYARKTLGASFKIERAGKPVKIKALPTGFRPAKQEKYVVVQKRRQRLKGRGERVEIIKSRKGGRWL